MLIKITPIALLSAFLLSPAHAEGYYISGKAITGNQYASSMDTSLRPRIGSFIEVDNQSNIKRGSFAFGYAFNNHWKVEAEYNTSVDSHFQSGSSRFANSLNNYQIDSEKMMVNGYRYFPVYGNLSVYGQAGLGVAKVKVGGWQRVQDNQFSTNKQTNIAYSIGAGARVAINASMSTELGYRYTDLGKVESGFNNFQNFSGLKDEQLKAHLTEQEIYIGLSYKI
ncbi:TPA: porin family protein [Aeromonas dhakensis]|uniref:outer membrane protein n=1 Tax=Aeromonas dhakensis TaxID=196024 RepID=UPI0028905B45|nr:porin family protein [Aeromonas dhakensis]